jgi:hypothetical protein
METALNRILEMDSFVAAFIIAASGAFYWRLGLWRPPPKLAVFNGELNEAGKIARKRAKKARSERRNRNILIWFFEYAVRFCVAFIFVLLIMSHFHKGYTEINTWKDFATKGPGYVLTLWFLFSITSGLINKLRRKKPEDYKDPLNRLLWTRGIWVLFIFWVIYLVLRVYGSARGWW